MAASMCEHPEFPSWTWRYNRDKHLTRFEPWYTRVDHWHPRYRHMGVPYNFRFHPMSGVEAASEGRPVPLHQMGLNYAKHLKEGRETGYGNAAVGCTPGPAPPKLNRYFTENPHPVPELYRVNEIDGITGGMSLWDNSRLDAVMPSSRSPPLDPSQYLHETLGQSVETTFPDCNYPPTSSRRYDNAKGIPSASPLDVWTERHRVHLAGHATERYCSGRRTLPPLESGVSSLANPMYPMYAQPPFTAGSNTFR